MLAGAGRSQETRGRREGTRPPAGSWLAGLGPSGRQSQPVVCCLSLSASAVIQYLSVGFCHVFTCLPGRALPGCGPRCVRRPCKARPCFAVGPPARSCWAGCSRCLGFYALLLWLWLPFVLAP
jgi:hypothetical protein